ncbi:MAG: 4'-phosphopantetheinyl transferase superfamily protein [Lachnospiraceae bacterium]|nr:4'-phosphopantetheinyl transferase superfamily protein [Lachnospiraceae bacterium]
MVKKKKIAYVFYTKVLDRLSYTHKELSEVGDLLLAYGLEYLYGIRLESEKKGKGCHGKPYLINHPEIQYNISHSGEYVVCVLSAMPVGIDIQEKRVMDVTRVGKRVFKDEEYREFLMNEDMQERFFRQWVLNESYLKWTGQGLTVDMREVETHGWHQFLHVDKNYMCALWAEQPLEIVLKEIMV